MLKLFTTSASVKDEKSLPNLHLYFQGTQTGGINVGCSIKLAISLRALNVSTVAGFFVLKDAELTGKKSVKRSLWVCVCRGAVL